MSNLRRTLASISAFSLVTAFLVAPPLLVSPAAVAVPNGNCQLGGSGTAEDPYIVFSFERLFDEVPDCDGSGIHFLMSGNFDMSAEGPVMPIAELRGHFDGGGHYIFGLEIVTAGPAGLFGELLPGSSLKNLSLVAPNIDGSSSDSSTPSPAGSFFGAAEGASLSNLVAYDATVFGQTGTASDVGAAGGIGGIVADPGTMEHLVYRVDPKATGSVTGEAVGGIFGALVVTLRPNSADVVRIALNQIAVNGGSIRRDNPVSANLSNSGQVGGAIGLFASEQEVELTFNDPWIGSALVTNAPDAVNDPGSAPGAGLIGEIIDVGPGIDVNVNNGVVLSFGPISVDESGGDFASIVHTVGVANPSGRPVELNVDKFYSRVFASDDGILNSGSPSGNVLDFYPIVTPSQDVSLNLTNVVHSSSSSGIPTSFPGQGAGVSVRELQASDDSVFDIATGLEFGSVNRFYRDTQLFGSVPHLFHNWARGYYQPRTLFGNRVENGNLLPEVELLGVNPHEELDLVAVVSPFGSFSIAIASQHLPAQRIMGASFGSTVTPGPMIEVRGNKAQLEEISRKIYLTPASSYSGLQLNLGVRQRQYSMNLMQIIQPVSVTTCSLTGSGSDSDPYLVTQPSDLPQIGQCLDNANTVHFRQTANIDLTGVKHVPIGHDYRPFNGVYDGGEFQVSALSINRPFADDMGFFGKFGDGLSFENTNVQVHDLTIFGSTVALIHGALLAGYVDSGKLINIRAEGDVAVERTGALIAGKAKNVEFGRIIANGLAYAKGRAGSTTSEVGLLVGELDGGGGGTKFLVDDVIVSGWVIGEKNQIGGMIGAVYSDPNGSQISRIDARVDVLGRNAFTPGDVKQIGGLVGKSRDVNYSDIIVRARQLPNTAEGKVLVRDSAIGLMDVESVGGFIGDSNEDIARDILVEVDVEIEDAGSAVDYVGGLYGSMREGLVERAGVSANVTGGEYTGGLVGKMLPDGAMTISEAEFQGDVSGASYVGGLVGQIESGLGSNAGRIVISQASSAGNVTASQSFAGGLVGDVQHDGPELIKIENSGFYGSVTGAEYTSGGIGSWFGRSGRSEIAGISVDATVIARPAASATYSDHAGGLFGLADFATPAIISDIDVRADLSGGSNVGGVLGQLRIMANADVSLNRVYFDGVVNAADRNAGGLVGQLNADTLGTSAIFMRQNAASGEVNGQTAAGGVIGYAIFARGQNSAHMSEASFQGDVNATSTLDHAGGVIGVLLVGPLGAFTLSDSYATGTVSALVTGQSPRETAGGLFGEIASDGAVEIANSYALAEVRATSGGNSHIGGFIGQLRGTGTFEFADNFFAADRSGVEVANSASPESASNLGEAEFASASNFAEFDIESQYDLAGASIWTYCPEIVAAAPVLRWDVVARSQACSAPITQSVTPPSYSGPIILSASETVDAAGLTSGRGYLILGSNLDAIESIRIIGMSLEILSKNDQRIVVGVPDSIPAGLYDLEITSSFGILTVPNSIRLAELVSENIQQASVAGWTSLKGDFVKVYAKNLVGVGKVQFLVNGDEIAWVRAGDESDPKLRFAGEAAYLVRSVELLPGKNVFEIYVEGERIRRVAYTLRN